MPSIRLRIPQSNHKVKNLFLSCKKRDVSKECRVGVTVRFGGVNRYDMKGVLSAICCKCFCWENNRNYLFV